MLTFHLLPIFLLFLRTFGTPTPPITSRSNIMQISTIRIYSEDNGLTYQFAFAVGDLSFTEICTVGLPGVSNTNGTYQLLQYWPTSNDIRCQNSFGFDFLQATKTSATLQIFHSVTYPSNITYDRYAYVEMPDINTWSKNTGGAITYYPTKVEWLKEMEMGPGLPGDRVPF